MNLRAFIEQYCKSATCRIETLYFMCDENSSENWSDFSSTQALFV